MTWRRIGEVFEAALGRPDADRLAFVRSACAGNEAMEAEVCSLLAEHAMAGGFLEGDRITIPFSDPGSLPEPASLAGTHVDGWRAIRELGRGGMGVVWLVERDAEGFRQQGALKLLRHGLMTEEMIRRFRRERRILATLSHPGIARLLDGGTTGDGVPYLVMEYVEGKTLYEHCRQTPLGLAPRLRLLIEVCDAVQSAHRRLVLHRDLKPSNVMVNSESRIKLLDFGVAKMFEDEEPESTALRTLALPATPDYASPEQLEGGTCTTASDVYSLGVVLFELATGRSPFVRRAGRPPERHGALRASAAAQSPHDPGLKPGALPPPPLEDLRALARVLSGDIDTIVAKALDPEPSRRYGSVAALAEDLENYLAGRPLLARPASWRYRAAKFVRRNRFAVAAAGIGLVALLCGLGVAVWQASVAGRQSRVAERRLREVRSMTRTLIFDVHDAAAILPGSAHVRELVVERAVEYLDRLAGEAGQDTALLRELGDAYERLARAQRDLVLPTAGDSAARTSEMKSLRLREALLAARPRDGTLRRKIEATRGRLGTVRVFETDFERGLPPELSAPGARIVRAQGFEGLGSEARAFRGQFLLYDSRGLSTLTLTLRNLPPHLTVSLSFLLAVIDSWDGSEVLEVRLDGRTLFAHWFQLSRGDTSSYHAPPGGLLSRGKDLGFASGTFFDRDRAYDLSADPAFSDIPHTADSLRVTWRIRAREGAGDRSQQWQGADDESWAIDNLRVEVAGARAVTR